jgi:hypothetical protein
VIAEAKIIPKLKKREPPAAPSDRLNTGLDDSYQNQYFALKRQKQRSKLLELEKTLPFNPIFKNSARNEMSFYEIQPETIQDFNLTQNIRSMGKVEIENMIADTRIR